MSEDTQGQPVIHNLLVEQTPGSNTFLTREPFTGTEEEAKEYAGRISQAEGRRVRVVNAAGDEVHMAEPHTEGDVES